MSVITTYLEMRSPAELRPKACDDDRFWVGEVTVPQGSFNRYLYRHVGTPWLWKDKREWTDEQWQTYVTRPELTTFAAYFDGTPAGYFELQQDGQGGLEITYFGLLPDFYGHGFGGVLLTTALEEAWRRGPQRVWVHTCSLDHPAALGNYLARGMRIYRTDVAP